MYKNYIFDLYGTLVDIYTNEHDLSVWTKVAKTLDFYDVHYNPEELHETYFAACELQMRAGEQLYDHPEIDIVDVFRRIFQNKGKKAAKGLACHLAQQFRSFSIEHLYLYKGAEDVLKQLKRAKKKIFLLTNAQKCFTLPELNKLGIRKMFNGIMYSSECGCAKPDVRFLNALLEKYKLDKKDCVLIGNDAGKDIPLANAVKMDSLYIKSNLSDDTDPFTVGAKYVIFDGNVSEISKLLLK